MRILNCRKVIPLIGLMLTFLSVAKVNAFEVTKRSELGIDESLSDQNSVTYSQPQKIYISEVKGFDPRLTNDSAKWVKLLYYYSITKLNLEDIPYNYLIDESGTVYEGRNGGAGSNASLSNDRNTVLIGYLSSKSSLTPRASDSLSKFVEELSYKYGIKEGNFGTIDLNIKKKEGSVSTMEALPVKGTFSDSVSQSLANVKWSNEEHLVYKASIQSVDYSKDVVIGETLKVSIKLKNENDFAWFNDSNYIYISTKDSKDSPFAVNSVWDSFSKPAHIDKTFIKAGETVDVVFELLAKSKPGSYSAEFNIVKSPNVLFEGSDFKVDFNITAGDYKLVRMYSPDYGFVNIRECRWYSCKKVEVANDGDVFITTKKEEGWYEIEYKKGSKGWVYQKYIKEL